MKLPRVSTYFFLGCCSFALVMVAESFAMPTGMKNPDAWKRQQATARSQAGLKPEGGQPTQRAQPNVSAPVRDPSSSVTPSVGAGAAAGLAGAAGAAALLGDDAGSPSTTGEGTHSIGSDKPELPPKPGSSSQNVGSSDSNQTLAQQLYNALREQGKKLNPEDQELEQNYDASYANDAYGPKGPWGDDFDDEE